MLGLDMGNEGEGGIEDDPRVPGWMMISHRGKKH